MKMTDIHRFARELREAHGDKALVEAARKAVAFETGGDDAQAEIWRRIEAALREMRGPRET